MANKRSFRENEALRIAREMLEKNKNNPAPVAPGMPAQTAKNNAYMRALQAFVTQSDFIGSDSAKRGAGDVLAYAMQGDAQANNVVNTLTSNANAKPVQRGDVASWDWETGRQTVIDNAAYMKMLRDAGVFDQEKYATPEYASFLSTGYLNKMLADTQARWDEDNAYNAQAAAWADKLANDPQFRSTWQHWNDMYNRTGEMTEDNAPYFWAYADYLIGDRAQPFDVNALDEQWGNLSDEDYYAEMARLQTQYEGLDLTGMATANAPQYRDVTGYFDEMGVWQKEINRRQRREELEAFAKGNPAFKDVSVYSGEVQTPEYYADYNSSKALDNSKEITQQRNASVDWLKQVTSSPYHFINAQMSMEAENSAASRYDAFSRMQARGYKFLTADEIAVYNTLYHTDPEMAQEYLDILQPELYQRVADTERMEQTVYAQNGGWAVPMWLGSVGAGIENAFLTPLQMISAATGNDDPNAPEFYFQRAQQNIRGAQDEVLGEIEALNGIKIFGKNPAQLLYGGVSMTADNVARLMFGPQGSLAMAGLQGASASLYENADRDDMSGAAKIIQALATGGLEIGTEKIGLDNLLDMGQDNALKYLLKAIGSEFGEESANYFGEYGVELAVSWLFGHEGEIRSGEELLYGWGETAVQTLISSGLMSTPGAIKTSSRVRGAGKTAQQQGDIDTLIGISAGMGENSEAGKWAARIKGKREKGARISNYEVGRMTMALEREVGAEMAEAPNMVMDEAIENRLLELGEDADNAKRLAPVLRKTYREQKVTRQDKKDMRWTANAEKVIKELTTDLEASAEEAGSQWKQIAEKSMETAMANAAEKASTFGKAAGLKGKGKGETPVQPVARTEQAADAAAKQGEDLAKNAPKIKTHKGQKVPPKAVAYTDDSGSGSGEVVKFISQQGKLQVEVETNDGDKTATKIIDPASIDAAGDAGIGAIVSYVQDAEGQTHAMSAEEANAMLQVYQVEGGEANAFIRAFEDAYLAGYANIEMNASTLSEQAANIAYEQGRAEATKDEKNRVRNASKIREASRGDVSWLGTVTDNADVRGGGSVENLKTAMENMTESQRSTVEVVQAFAKTFKTNVVLFESSEANVEGLQNGFFHEDTNTIYIDINAGANNAQDIGIRRRTVRWDMRSCAQWAMS